MDFLKIKSIGKTSNRIPLETKEKLNEMKLDEAERLAYNVYKRRIHDRASEEYNKELEVRFAIEDAEEKGKREEREKAEAEKQQMILAMHTDGMSIEKIAKFTQKTETEVAQIIAGKKLK